MTKTTSSNIGPDTHMDVDADYFGADDGEPVARGKQVKFRFRDALYGELRKASRARGTTLSNEVTTRLEMSFAKQDMLTDALALSFKKEVAQAMVALGTALDEAVGASKLAASGRISSSSAKTIINQSIAAMHSLIDGMASELKS
jgi:C4-dicarboxylate-specific signal transduction histidine kinase